MRETTKKLKWHVFCIIMAGLATIACSQSTKVDDGATVEEFLELCKTGTPQQIQAAIKAGADAGAKDGGDLTALDVAAENDNPEIASVLKKAGAR